MEDVFTIGELARPTGLSVRTLRFYSHAGVVPPTASLWATMPRVERYWQLLGVVNGWDPFPAMTPAFAWTIEALRAHPSRRTGCS